MSERFGNGVLGAGRTQFDVVAEELNRFLHRLVMIHAVGERIRPRVEVAVLGYGGSTVCSALGGSLATRTLVTLPELNAEPLHIDARTTKEMDGTGIVTLYPDRKKLQSGLPRQRNYRRTTLRYGYSTSQVKFQRLFV